LIDHLLALRIIISAIAIYFFYRSWKLCKHKSLLLLATQQVTTTLIRVLMAFKVLKTGSPLYNALLIVVCVFSALGAYLLYFEFNKAYQEGRYAKSPS